MTLVSVGLVVRLGVEGLTVGYRMDTTGWGGQKKEPRGTFINPEALFQYAHLTSDNVDEVRHENVKRVGRPSAGQKKSPGDVSRAKR